ncbi:MAG: hypothetical protein KF787_02590 [Phycisphaeraceae bacterium]|nr:hypothetical protein [Phycisphaerae bacterium]MBX3391514.1 hypothetical protein [Phycisphaeraceae bacterium]
MNEPRSNKVNVRLPDEPWAWFRENLASEEQEIFLDSLQHIERVRVPGPMRIGNSRETTVTLELPVTDGIRAIFVLDRSAEPGTLTLVGWREGSNR